MNFLLLGSLLMFGGLLAFGDVFNSNDSEEEPTEPDIRHGGAGSDTMIAEEGETMAGWGGNDDLTLGSKAQGFGNQGNDTIEAYDDSSAYGGTGNDYVYGTDSAKGFGDAGNDRMEASNNATLRGGDGDDVIYASVTWPYDGTLPDDGTMPTVYGDAGNDLMTVDAGHGYGGDGNDQMTGTGFANLPVYAALGTTISGGAGDDLMQGWQNAQLAGDAGNDTLVLGLGAEGADGYGGVGNDTLILNTGYSGVTAAGDAGNDNFVIAAPPNFDPTTDPLIIADFTLGEDRLLVEAAGGQGGDYLYHHATITTNVANGYTDVMLHWQSQSDPSAETTSLVRLNGLQSFDVANIDLVSDVQAQPAFLPAPASTVGALIEAATGSAGVDTFTGQRDVLLTTGAGDDTVTTANGGTVVVGLGDGDDSFVATGAAHLVFGGAGDDSYVADAPNGFAASGFASGFDGGAGNDQILIHGDGAVIPQPGHAPHYVGGAGADHLEAQAGTGPLDLYGGAGDDVLIGRAGQTFDNRSAGNSVEGSDDITITLTAAELAANGPARVGFGTTDHLTLNIDADLTGPVTMVYHTASNGAEVTRTDILVGGRVVAVVTEGIPLIDDAIALDDPRLTVRRA